MTDTSLRLRNPAYETSRTSIVLVVVLLSIVEPTSGRAEDSQSPYCRKVRAKIDEEAASLIWPRVVAQAIHFPSDTYSVGPTISHNVQVRVGMSASLTDAWRALRLGDVADADCELHEAAEPLDRLVRELVNEKTVPPLRYQQAYLESRQEQWRALTAQGRQRLKAGAITVLELQDLLRIVSALDRKLEVVRGEVNRSQSRLSKTDRQDTRGSLKAITEAYVERAMKLERELGKVRALDPWSVRLSGGAIPAPDQRTPQWYGALELSYSLGGISQGRSRDRYLEAREAEIHSARYELPAQVEKLREGVRAQISQAEGELHVVRRELDSIVDAEKLLDGSEASRGDYGRAVLNVQRLSLESDRIFLTSLVGSLREIVEN